MALSAFTWPPRSTARKGQAELLVSMIVYDPGWPSTAWRGCAPPVALSADHAGLLRARFIGGCGVACTAGKITDIRRGEVFGVRWIMNIFYHSVTVARFDLCWCLCVYKSYISYHLMINCYKYKTGNPSQCFNSLTSRLRNITLYIHFNWECHCVDAVS